MSNQSTPERRSLFRCLTEMENGGRLNVAVPTDECNFCHRRLRLSATRVYDRTMLTFLRRAANNFSLDGKGAQNRRIMPGKGVS